MTRFRQLGWIAVGMIALCALPASNANAFAGTPPRIAGAPARAAPDASLVPVHGWHCRRLWARGWGWHRNPGACRNRNRRNRYRRNRNRRDRYYDPDANTYRELDPKTQEGNPTHRKNLSDAYRRYKDKH